MNEKKWLADEFEANRAHLRAAAYRMLGSRSEAEDAVQETWLRLNRTDTTAVDNLGGWLTTVIARICLDMLRARKTRREEPLEMPVHAAIADPAKDPEREAAFADSIGLALLVVLQTLAPAERVAFVLHDMFDLPFDEIASIIGRSSAATRQLASRARRRVQGMDEAPEVDLGGKRRIAEAFLTASRNGDVEALIAVLAPDVSSGRMRQRLDTGPLAGGAELPKWPNCSRGGRRRRKSPSSRASSASSCASRVRSASWRRSPSPMAGSRRSTPSPIPIGSNGSIIRSFGIETNG